MGTSHGDDSIANWAGPPPRRYANYLGIEFSLSEFTLRFGQHAADKPEPLIHSVVVSTPVHIAIFCQEFRAAILRYESRFGPIPGWFDPNSSITRQ